MLDNFYSFRFVYLLTQKWEDTDAYKLGIIDKDGNILKKRETLQTTEEKKSYTKFHHLVWNIRRLLEKVPFAKMSIAKYATALWLLKEETGYNFESLFQTHLLENNIVIPDIITEQKDSDFTKYTKVFNIDFMIVKEELVLVSEMETVANIDIVDKPLGKKKILTRTDEDLGDIPVIEPDEHFAGNPVFHCDSDTFHNCRMGKSRYAKYKTYVGEDEIGEKIKTYSKANLDKSIILKNKHDGSMIYLRRK